MADEETGQTLGTVGAVTGVFPGKSMAYPGENLEEAGRVGAVAHEKRK